MAPRETVNTSSHSQNSNQKHKIRFQLKSSSTFSSYLLKGSYLERATVNLRIITSDCDGLKVICKICITRREGRKEERPRGGLKGACTTPLILPEAFQYLYRICCITSFVLSAGKITLLPRYSLFKFV